MDRCFRLRRKVRKPEKFAHTSKRKGLGPSNLKWVFYQMKQAE